MKPRITFHLALFVLGLVVLSLASLGCSSEKAKMYESQLDRDKQDLQARLQSSIADVDTSITELKTEVARETPEVKAQIEQKMHQLDSVKTVLNEKLTRLGETTRSQWEKFKADATKTIDDAEQYVKSVPGALGTPPARPDTTSASTQ